MVARDVADIGRPDITLDDVLLDWSGPGIDPALDCFVADDDGAIVGYAVVEPRGCVVMVHPEAEGRGIGTALREAAEARAKERGVPVQQPVVPTSVAAVEHLRAAGYESSQFYLRMRVPLEDAPSGDPAAPIRRFDLDADGPAVHELIEEAFTEIEGNVPESFDAWYAYMTVKSEPAFRLVLEDDEGLAGSILGSRWENGVGYVSHIAVARRARGRGHGRTMLLAMFDAFRAEGLSIAELSVAGTNAAATGLYESAGMALDFRGERWVRR
jgi:ribosomal protein S18 acetylase RimI-like enzyme